MSNLLFEKLEDDFINLFEVWIFIKSFEYSALILSKELDYKYYINCDKKKAFIFLEIWFPKTKLEQNISILLSKWYSIRYIDKNNKIIEYKWELKNIKDKKYLLNIKQKLIKLE